MERAEALVFLEVSRVGRLATVRPDGRPHVVPVTFAVTEEVVVTMVDHKPKTTNRLQRLTNIEANPSASLIVDEWSEDWDRLRWVRVDGTARIHTEGRVWDQSRAALVAKYPQYGEHPPEGPAIAIAIEGVSGWVSRQ
ncbi:MAG TPA: TIGR03668 family PPOX class F420-dependent oxidoreductase [Acidimicrobiia bacterium]|nr:TIGR03668 family PPOX class F420-dependent oxidoreductase [Acidimicrobiia bacterium]